jgi:hypothetical protein
MIGTLTLRTVKNAARAFAALAILLLPLPRIAAQVGSLPLPGEKEKEVQFVSALPTAPVSVRAGDSTRVQLRFRVAAGNHINSSLPKSALLIPTKLKFAPPTDIAVGKIEYPQGQELAFTFAPKEKLNVYTGEFLVSALLRPTRSAAPGTYRVHGELLYQACNDRACYPPKKLPVAFEVNVGRARYAPSARGRNPGQSPHVHH